MDVLGTLKGKLAQAGSILDLLKNLPANIPLDMVIEVIKDIQALGDVVSLKDKVAIALRIATVGTSLTKTEVDDQVVAVITKVSSGNMGQAFIDMVDRLLNQPAPAAGDFTVQSIDTLATPDEKEVIEATFEPQSLLLIASLVSATVSVLRYTHDLRKDKEEEERKKKEEETK